MNDKQALLEIDQARVDLERLIQVEMGITARVSIDIFPSSEPRAEDLVAEALSIGWHLKPSIHGGFVSSQGVFHFGTCIYSRRYLEVSGLDQGGSIDG